VNLEENRTESLCIDMKKAFKVEKVSRQFVLIFFVKDRRLPHHYRPEVKNFSSIKPSPCCSTKTLNCL